jgi:Family of unknown function (DUF6218)
VVSVVEEHAVGDASGLVVPVVALWAPGSAVLATGLDASGEPAVAVWQVSPDGHPTGSWVVPDQQAYTDAPVARQLLVTVERRALAATDEGTVDDVLSRLTTAAGITRDRWWAAQRFSPVDAFADLLARRAELAATVTAIRQSGRTVAPLQWDRTFSIDDQPTTFGGLAELAKIPAPAGAPVVAETLRLSRLLQWLVGLWAQTEQVKNRRDYLRDKLGDPEALPPAWMAAVQTASATRLPL